MTLSTEMMQEALDHVHRHGGNQRAAARDMAIGRTTLQYRLNAAQRAGLTPADDDPRQARLSLEQLKQCDKQGIPAGQLSHGWDKDAETGKSYFFKVPKAQEDPDELVGAIISGLKSAPKAKPKKRKLDMRNLCAIFPIADLHIGLLTDEEEVGVDWDSKIALGTFERTFASLVALSPGGKEAVIANLGDLIHVNDQRNVTPGSGHQLDTDSRFFQSLRRAVAAMKFAIDTALTKYERVTVRNQRGNHDEMPVYAVTLALGEHYRDEPRVEVIQSANEFYVHEFGKNMTLLAHGDKTSAERLVMFAAAEYPEIWARTNNRTALTGHVHHQSRKEFSGMVVETLGSIIPRDAYAHSHAYGAMRGLVSIVLDHDEGEIARIRQGVK